MKLGAGWKNFERREAHRQDTTRIWRQDFSEEKPDGETTRYVWDCKYRKSLSVVTTFLDCERKYRDFTGNRTFYLALHSGAHHGDFVVLRAEDFHSLRRTSTYRLEE